MPKRCVVTGGLGFVGQRLVETLVERGAEQVDKYTEFRWTETGVKKAWNWKHFQTSKVDNLELQRKADILKLYVLDVVLLCYTIHE